jgi:PAS domain S-box-containing protein
LSHRDKISSHKKSIYYIALGAIIFVVLTVFANVLVQQRINSLYNDVFKTSLKVNEHISKARSFILLEIIQESKNSVRGVWEEFDQAEVLTYKLTGINNDLVIPFISLNDVSLKSALQKLQIHLLDYRVLCGNVIASGKNSLATPTGTAWEAKYAEIEHQSKLVEHEADVILRQQSRMFQYIQVGLVTATAILGIIALFVFVRYQHQQSSYLKKMEEASAYLELGLKKTTRAEEALQESQRQLNTLINNLPGMVYRFKGDAIWSMDFVSDNCLVLTGYRPEQLMNDKDISYYDSINPEDRKKIFAQVQKSIEERKPYQLVYRIKTTSGYEKWVWEQGVGIFNETNDELVALEGFITDITEQKTVEEQLNIQSNALEAAANGIVLMDPDGKVLWCNSAFTTLTGYSMKEIIGNELTILKSPKFPLDLIEMMWNSVLAGEVWHGEIINRKKDGTDYYDDTTITPIKDSDGRIKYVVAIKQDISSRKLTEATIIESELRFRGLYENASIGLFRTSPDGKILLANPALLNIVGANSIDEISSKAAAEFYADPSTRTVFQKELRDKGRISGFESRWKRKDGSLIYVRESARAIKDENNAILYYEGTVEDISEKKKAEEDIILAKEKAEKSDRLKTEFLAQMSHEIRTPLNVILNFSSILKDELQNQVDDELRSAFDVMEMEGKRIMRTVELILNMSELQTGNYNYRADKMNLLEMIKKLNSDFEYITKQKKIPLNLVCHTENSNLVADEYSINQVFYHLLDNAIKYTSVGKIDIIINRDINNRLYVDVIDSGIGIDEEYMSQLFMPFTKEEQGYTRNFEGNGLGLALVKRYCELNNAEVKVNSQKGKGSTFRVTFLNIN